MPYHAFRTQCVSDQAERNRERDRERERERDQQEGIHGEISNCQMNDDRNVIDRDLHYISDFSLYFALSSLPVFLLSLN